MTTEEGEQVAVRHLSALARQPRPAGGHAEQKAREYAANTLAALAFSVREESFSYSSFPGRFGAPLTAVLLFAAIASAGWFALGEANVQQGLIALFAGAAMVTAFARCMFSGVLDFPWLRAAGVNLVATRGAGEPRVWLVAHLDSKSQPVPSLARIVGVVLLAAGFVASLSALLLTLGGHDARTLWWGAVAVAAAGALPVAASLVGAESDGAVDNASGVAAVLAAAGMLRRDAPCGVLLTSAEELGLAGARAWVRDHARSIAINCDGVDDEGSVVMMFNGHRPVRVEAAVRAASSTGVRVRRMPAGLLTDSTALAAGGWLTATVSHGSFRTLRRVHTKHDSLVHLRGTSIEHVAGILAGAAEALAR